MITTLNQIRENNPSVSGWKILLNNLDKKKADDEPLSIIKILDSNGLDDALWCLQSVKDQDKTIRLYAVWCARQVQYLMTDPRSISALDISERFAYGLATRWELNSAWENARSVKGSDVGCASASRRVAAMVEWAAANAATWAAAGVAAGVAAWASRAAGGTAMSRSQETELRRICT